MSHDDAGEHLSQVIDGFAEHLQRVRHAQQQRAQIVAAARSAANRVTVTVNADGALVDLRFAEDIGDLDYDDIAAAVLTAARDAAAAAAGQAQQLMASVQQRPAAIPTIAELIDDIPELRAQLRRT